MKWFKKKQSEPTPISRSPCEMFGHVWQDLPWYLEEDYNSSYNSTIQIIEPYICRICHEIKYETLTQEREKMSRSKHDEKVVYLKNKYKRYMKPKPVVMDMLNDIKLIDKEKLKYWQQLHSPTEAENEIDAALAIIADAEQS